MRKQCQGQSRTPESPTVVARSRTKLYFRLQEWVPFPGKLTTSGDDDDSIHVMVLVSH